MKRMFLLSICTAITAALGLADSPGIQVIGYDNIHIRVPEPAKAVEWYVKYLGATSPTAGQLYFGKQLIAVVKTTNPQPSTGSVIDHFGISYPDIESKLKEAEAGGAHVISPPRDIPGFLKFAYIEDPWGVKIELLQDADLIGFHHVHLRVKDPEATLTWYQDTFGGKRDKLKGRIEGLRYGSIWLFVAASNQDSTVSSADRAIMSFGLDVSDIHAAAAELERRGIKLPVAPRQLGDLWYAFAEDPNGTRVELLQRPSH